MPSIGSGPGAYFIRTDVDALQAWVGDENYDCSTVSSRLSRQQVRRRQPKAATSPLLLSQQTRDSQVVALLSTRRAHGCSEQNRAGSGWDTRGKTGVIKQTFIPPAWEFFPKLLKANLDKKERLPLGSASEALQRPEPFLNRALASPALATFAL